MGFKNFGKISFDLLILRSDSSNDTPSIHESERFDYSALAAIFAAFMIMARRQPREFSSNVGLDLRRVDLCRYSLRDAAAPFTEVT